MGSQSQLGVGPPTQLSEGGLAFGRSKPDTAIHGLVSRAGCLRNAYLGPSLLAFPDQLHCRSVEQLFSSQVL
jgi:hypothetical protein